MKHKWIIGIIIIIIVCAIIAISSTNVINNNGDETNSSDIVLKVIAQGPWDADITGNDGYDSLYDEGNATYDMKGDSISVTIVKQSNDDAILKAQLIKDGKVISEQSTDAPLGTITVKMES